MAFRFDPYAPETDANPFPAYKVLRDEYPCFWSEEAGMWVLSRYDDVLAALTNWRVYSSSKGNLIDEFPGRAGSTLGSSDPPRHDRLRALIQSAMTKRALDHVLEPARASCAAHLAEIADLDVFDFVNDFGSKVTVDLLFYLFALPRDQAEQVRDNAVLMVQTDATTRQKSAEHLAAFHWMADYAEKLVQDRKQNPGDDLLSGFITAEIDGEKLLDKEVQLTVTTLIMAGIESLSGFMGMFALNLADHPEARRALVADPALIPDAMEESLRFNTSAQRFKRTVMVDRLRSARPDHARGRPGDAVPMAAPTATNGCSPIPTPTTSPASPGAMSALAAGSIRAWARCWRGSRPRWCSRNSSRPCRVHPGRREAVVGALVQLPQPAGPAAEARLISSPAGRKRRWRHGRRAFAPGR
jgi:hypothetical protein